MINLIILYNNQIINLVEYCILEFTQFKKFCYSVFSQKDRSNCRTYLIGVGMNLGSMQFVHLTLFPGL